MSTPTKVRQTVSRKFVPGRASASHSVKALALYASIVGRQAGVEIVFGDFDTAMTDGKKIFIPTLVNVAEEKWVVILRALIDHEVMHVRQTKFEAVLACNSPLSKVLSNILEDCWGEREQAKVYPGSLKAIRAGMDELVALRWFAPPPPNSSQVDPRAAFVNWLLHDLRGRHFVMPELSAWAQQWRSLAEPAFGAGLLDAVLTLMHEVDICKSSAQAVAIANRVVDLLRAQQEELRRQAQQQRGAKPPPSPDSEQASGGEPGAKANDGEDGGEGAGSGGGDPEGDRQPGGAGTPDDADAAERADGNGRGSDACDGDQNPPADGSPKCSAAGAQESPDGAEKGGQGASGAETGCAPEPAKPARSPAASTPSDSSTGSAGGHQGTKASGPAEQAPGGDGAGSGAGSGWTDSPEVLERRAGHLGSAVNASLQELPATEMADAICSELQGASVMQSPGEHVTGTHARILSSKICDIPTVEDDSEGLAEEAEVRALSKSIERRLGAKLRDKLEARTQSSTTYGRRGLRVGSHRLSRAKAGVLDVFRKTEDGMELSIAVSLVVDMSGSMARVFGSTLRRVGAAGAAYAIAEVLGKFAIPFSWVNFGSSALAVKRFAVPWRKRRDSKTVDGLGGTELDVPLLRLLPELAARDEERKLFLVITDGDPDNADEVVAVLSLMPMMGVEVAMFFIGSEGAELERKLAAQGLQVARANRPEDLAQGLFEAVDNAFI